MVEFWSTFATLQEQEDVLQRLTGYLPRLIPILVVVGVRKGVDVRTCDTAKKNWIC